MKRVPHGYWKIEANRVGAIRGLVNKLEKPPSEVTRKDFEDNGLWGLLVHYYSSSPFRALKEAGYDIKEWERGQTVKFFWKKRENRVKAIKDFVEKLGKPPTQITYKDFKDNGLGGVFDYYGSPYKALKDAGYEFEPWEMDRIVRGTLEKRETRIKIIKEFVENFEKPMTEITHRDFVDAGLGALLTNYYSSSPHKALTDAGYEILEWQMESQVPQSFWKKKDNRIKAIKWLVSKVDRPVNEFTKQVFEEHGLGGLLNEYYSASPHDALKDAGFPVKKGEMPRGLYSASLQYESDHGHWFRSIEERDLDDLFWSHNLKDHKHDVPYPNSRYTCDFVFGSKYWVEYAGLLGKGVKDGKGSYDERVKQKKNIAKENNFELIIITRKEVKSGEYKRKINHIINELGSFEQNLDYFID